MVRQTNLVRALRTLKLSGFWVVGVDVNASSPIGTMDLPDKCILAFGAEGRGLRRLTHDACDLLVRIPTTDAIQSLNVSASAAIALYEWNRHRENNAKMLLENQASGLERTKTRITRGK